MKPVKLRNTHYAAEWKMEGVVKSLPELDDLGRRYACLPAEIEGKSNPQKQDLLLELCQCFHPYFDEVFGDDLPGACPDYRYWPEAVLHQ